MDYEDCIGGGSVKTRFKYTNVGKADFGLTNEEILLLDDRKLNDIVSIKKLRPYREDKQKTEKDEKRDQYIAYAKKNGFKQDVENQLKVLKEVQQSALEQEKAKYLKKAMRKK